MPDLWRSTVARYLVVGGINTVFTYLILFGLLYVASAAVAYAVAFVAGLVFNTLAVGPYVFGTRPPVRRKVFYGLWLVATFACGLAAVQAATSADLPPAVVAAVPPLVTAPLGFLGGRLLLASIGRSGGQGGA